jgi:periplasmic protein CpxP/Spy
MKTNRMAKVAAAVALVTLVFAGGAYAFGRGMRGGKFMKHMIAMRVEEAEDFIEATPDQRKVIDAAKDSILGKLEAKQKEQQAGGPREQWAKLFLADKVSESDVYAKVDAKADEAKAFARQIVPDLIKVHDVLTPAQRQKLADHLKERGHHGFGGPGFGGPGFGPPPPGGPGAGDEE